MFEPPTRTKLPVETVPVEPAVLPRLETPAKTPPSPPPPPAGTLMTTEPFETPTEAIPAPAKMTESRFMVPVLDWVVFDVAKNEPRSSVRATEPFVFVQDAKALSEKPSV